MLPNTEDKPALSSQLLEIPLIPAAVSFYLLPPIFAEFILPLGEPPAMPKIAINEHCNSCA